jgi:hypothetical protein
MTSGGPVAILCPGPSLRHTWPPRKQKYTSVVGVNAAMAFAPLDWWCCLDPDAWGMDFGTGRNYGWPKVGLAGYTSPCAEGSPDAHLLRGRTPPRGLKRVDLYGELAKLPQSAGNVANWSITAAIYFAATHLAATSVDLYGCDQTGSDYAVPTERDAARLNRWERERADFHKLCAYLQPLVIRKVNHANSR